MKIWIGFDFYFLFLFRQDYQEFFACGGGLSAEGRIIKKILHARAKLQRRLVNPVQLFSFKKESIPLFSNYMVSYLIRLDARGQRLR